MDVREAFPAFKTVQKARFLGSESKNQNSDIIQFHYFFVDVHIKIVAYLLLHFKTLFTLHYILHIYLS